MSERVPYIKPDGWLVGDRVYDDDRLPAPFNMRLKTGYKEPGVTDIAVVLMLAGTVPNRYGFYRVTVVFPGDGEPNEASGGWANLEALDLFNIRIPGRIY